MADMNLEVNAKDFFSRIKLADRRAMDAGETAMGDNVDELIRISSEITPFYKGTLSRSHKRKVTRGAGQIDGRVEYSVIEGDFDYARWIHEGVYNLGVDSRQRPGTTGKSGKKYSVGRKYLSRPLNGESDYFTQHFAAMIRKGLGD